MQEEVKRTSKLIIEMAEQALAEDDRLLSDEEMSNIANVVPAGFTGVAGLAITKAQHQKDEAYYQEKIKQLFQEIEDKTMGYITLHKWYKDLKQRDGIE